jgi:hypothetical protein
VHTGKPVDPEQIIRDHARAIAEEIDREIMSKW